MLLRLGTRRSALAIRQAEGVAKRLKTFGVDVQLVPITTRGDRVRGSLEEIAGQGVFTKEIQAALLAGQVDVAVHSLKDLPTAGVAGLTLAAIPERGPAGDVLISGDGSLLAQLPKGATIATSSLRRRAQLAHFRPDLQFCEIRGNVDTRLRKLAQGGFQALVLAEAGLERLGLGYRLSERLSLEIMLPAVGQGALAVECRADDHEVLRRLALLDHLPSRAAVLAERSWLSALDGGCRAPLAAFASVEGEKLSLRGRVLSLDGARLLEARLSAPLSNAEDLGRRLAEELLAQGAAELIRAARDG